MHRARVLCECRRGEGENDRKRGGGKMFLTSGLSIRFSGFAVQAHSGDVLRLFCRAIEDFVGASHRILGTSWSFIQCNSIGSLTAVA
jgi:hypothetical protein